MIRVGSYVTGIASPLVFGKIVARDGAFFRLDTGGVFPIGSVKRTEPPKRTRFNRRCIKCRRCYTRAKDRCTHCGKRQ